MEFAICLKHCIFEFYGHPNVGTCPTADSRCTTYHKAGLRTFSRGHEVHGLLWCWRFKVHIMHLAADSRFAAYKVVTLTSLRVVYSIISCGVFLVPSSCVVHFLSLIHDARLNLVGYNNTPRLHFLMSRSQSFLDRLYLHQTRDIFPLRSHSWNLEAETKALYLNIAFPACWKIFKPNLIIANPYFFHRSCVDYRSPCYDLLHHMLFLTTSLCPKSPHAKFLSYRQPKSGHEHLV